MKRYAVSKQYGHFTQIWELDAMNEKEAWDNAEKEGKLKYQTVYKEVFPTSNYVTCLTDNLNDNTISQEQYDIWLEEAKSLGMVVDEYLGLPFNDVR